MFKKIYFWFKQILMLNNQQVPPNIESDLNKIFNRNIGIITVAAHLICAQNEPLKIVCNLGLQGGGVITIYFQPNNGQMIFNIINISSINMDFDSLNYKLLAIKMAYEKSHLKSTIDQNINALVL